MGRGGGGSEQNRLDIQNPQQKQPNTDTAIIPTT